MNELDQKQKKIVQIASVAAFLLLSFLFAPFALATIKGALGLLVTLAIGITAIYVGIPWFTSKLIHWRLKALKAAAAANPVEELEHRYMVRKDLLFKQRENIKQRIAIASKIFSQIQGFETQFHKPSPRRDAYGKVNQLIEIRKEQYKQAQVALVRYSEALDEKRADWEIFQSMQEESKLRQAGEDFLGKLQEDTAFNTIQTGVDTAFAELDATVMDESIDRLLRGERVDLPSVTAPAPVAQVEASKPKQLSAPSDLDFDAVPARSKAEV